MAVADARCIPLAAGIAGGQQREVTVVDETLDAAFIDELPMRLIDYKAYDSNVFDAPLQPKSDDVGRQMATPLQVALKDRASQRQVSER